MCVWSRQTMAWWLWKNVALTHTPHIPSVFISRQAFSTHHLGNRFSSLIIATHERLISRLTRTGTMATKYVWSSCCWSCCCCCCCCCCLTQKLIPLKRLRGLTRLHAWSTVCPFLARNIHNSLIFNWLAALIRYYYCSWMPAAQCRKVYIDRSELWSKWWGLPRASLSLATCVHCVYT